MRCLCVAGVEPSSRQNDKRSDRRIFSIMSSIRVDLEKSNTLHESDENETLAEEVLSYLCPCLNHSGRRVFRTQILPDSETWSSI
jgi:hypothetical protein